MRKFDPLSRKTIQNVTNYQYEILDLYDTAKYEGEEKRGRRYIRWRLAANLQILEQLIAKDAPAVRKTIQNIG